MLSTKTARVLTLAAWVLSVGPTGLHAATPAKGAEIKNPVPATPESIKAGKLTYLRQCAQCHGQTGKGDGGGSVAGGKPSDLTDAKWDHGGSDGEIYTTLHDGTSPDMVGYGGRINENDLWNLVNFILSIGPKAK